MFTLIVYPWKITSKQRIEAISRYISSNKRQYQIEKQNGFRATIILKVKFALLVWCWEGLKPQGTFTFKITYDRLKEVFFSFHFLRIVKTKAILSVGRLFFFAWRSPEGKYTYIPSPIYGFWHTNTKNSRNSAGQVLTKILLKSRIKY